MSSKNGKSNKENELVDNFVSVTGYKIYFNSQNFLNILRCSFWIINIIRKIDT